MIYFHLRKYNKKAYPWVSLTIINIHIAQLTPFVGDDVHVHGCCLFFSQRKNTPHIATTKKV